MTDFRVLLLALAMLLAPAGLAVPLPAQNTNDGEAEAESELPVSPERLEEIARGFRRERVGVPTPTPPPLPDLRTELRMDLRTVSNATIGEEATLEFTLHNAAGLPAGAADLTAVRGRRAELHLIDQGLDDYHVLVPEEQDGEPGTFRATFRPMNGGEYSAFLVARPATTHLLEVLPASFRVAGSTAGWRSDERLNAVAGGYSFSLEFRGTPRAERLVHGNLTIRNAEGAIANEELAPLGEDRVTILAVSQHRNRAFLAGFPYYETVAAGARGPIPFTLMVDHPGVWHLFVRARAGERELHVPLIVHVRGARDNETNEEVFAELDRLMVGMDQLRRTDRIADAVDLIELMKRQFGTIVDNLDGLPEPNQTAVPSALFRVEQSLDHVRRFGLAQHDGQFRMAHTQLQREMDGLRQASMVPARPDALPVPAAACPYTGTPVGSDDLGAHVFHRDQRVDFSSFTKAALFAQDMDHHMDAIMMGRATEE